MGYGHPRWLAALERQARQMAFQTNALPMTVRERAAARLAKFAGLGLDTVFWINSGAEANENALKIAFKMTGRHKAVALEQGWHGRTAAAGAVTWGALEKWYGFPRTPFDVVFTPRDKPAALERCVDRNTAAVIVEPIQGVGGAYDVGKPMLQALRQRCDEVGALLIFDEVQCGMGRTGSPFAANYYGVTPDIITAAKALGNGFPVSALLLSRRVARQIKYDDMGTTFGGGPMACAVAESVIDTIESESLLANVRQVSTYIRSHCVIGPITGVQGAGFLLGLKTSRPAKEVQAALLEKDILAGTSADPHMCCACCRHTSSTRATSIDCSTHWRRFRHESLPQPCGFQARPGSRSVGSRPVAGGQAAAAGARRARSWDWCSSIRRCAPSHLSKPEWLGSGDLPS